MDPSRCGSKVSGSGSIQLHRSKNLYRRFLADAAAGLSFSHDCVVDLGAGGVSYSRADFRPLFRPTGALKPSAKGRPQDRKLCRPAPRPKVQQAERFGDLLPVLEPPESLDQLGSELLQGSCGPARATAVSSADHHPKRASGSAKPVQKVAHRDHDHSTGDNSPKYHKNPQRWFSPGPQRRTGPAPDNKTTGGLKRDLTEPADQVQTAAVPSWTPTGPRPQSGSHAAQCSALDGDHSRKSLQTLSAQLLLCQDRRPDAQLLGSQLTCFSSQTTLVRSLLAEQLNSSEWRSRLLSCDILSSFAGPINKDVVHKLTRLMWSDQRRTVRLAAAEALMKLGKTQEVYKELWLKLEEGRGLQFRMEALDVISHLKIETLLEPLVSRLSDEFTAVRKQACLTAEFLQLKDETVVSRLLELAENDPAQEVRLSALRAVGALGLSSPDVQETLLRCVETAEEAELRLAACRLLRSAGVTSARLRDFLLQRVDVESSQLVRRTMEDQLRLCGCDLREECRHAKYIRLQVRRLCECRALAEKVLLLEKLQVGGRSIGPGTLARLLSQRYRTPDQ
ncbi:HEAT repeat-containing protein 4 [Micropterus salmoides]|uniref:HEAT repeat-containing protein 4 n=1 Tax=Micropterus salmoides TaxID=27706 RepID=UPI0018EB5257|nr:HEAT repeat-containing protein 4 [Micropterus salmoides]XP_038585785.1 HEAT repeat-containing protein 4 [Micropterus salmoides]